MLGSSVDAEDAVQETFLRAWRASGRFEGRASLRTWLYRIATNVCLDALARSARRPVPIEELPEPMIDISGEPDPFDRALTRETARSAVLAAVGLLPPRQRAALLLREVLSWRANEAADLLGTSTAAVNSALQRARVTLQALDPEDMIEASDAEEGELVNRYVDALAEDDIDTLVALVSLEPAA
jgi:RNA polymerase sigma-70 factor (ECF subfamily)